MRCFIYSRKSVYTGKGESVENQIEMCRAYICAKFPADEPHQVAVYEDEGFSAKTTDRPQFRQMLCDMRTDSPNYLVCYRLDRISRSVSDFSALIEELNRRSIAFLCIKEEFDTSKPMGKAMMYIASVFAQLERETIAERVRDNMCLLARTGRWLGGMTPLGFTSEQVREIVVDGRVKTACRLREAEEELRIVDLIFTRYLDTGSVSFVGKSLLREGFHNRKGGAFSLPGIKEILQNPVYCVADSAARRYFVEGGAEVCFREEDCTEAKGMLAYNKRDYTKKNAPRQSVDRWIVAIGSHRGRIGGSQWVAVQRRLKDSVPTGEKPAKMHNGYALLSGMIDCAICGSRMFAKTRGGRGTGFDYLCGSKLRGGMALCNCQNLAGAHTDAQVFAQLAICWEEDGGLRDGLEQLRRRLHIQARESPHALLEGQIRRCDEEGQRLVEHLGRGAVDGALLRRVSERVAALEAKRDALLLQRESIQRAQPDIERLAHTLAHPVHLWTDLTLTERRAMVKLLVGRMVWDGTGLQIFLT